MVKPPRILIPVAQLPLDTDKIRGGVHSALMNLLHGLRDLPVEILVVSLSKEVQTRQIVSFSNNINIHYYFEGNAGFHIINYWKNGSRIMQSAINDFNPDIIHFQEGNSFLLIKPTTFPASKTLITVHGFALKEAHRKKKIKDKITWYINGWINPFLLPKNIIHLSRFSTLIRNKKADEKTVIIPNAINNIFFDLPIKNRTDNKLLYLGIIDNNKNLIYTLNVLSALVQKGIIYNLDVMGGFSNAEYENLIMQLVREKKLEQYVVFHGWVNQAQVLEQLKKSDILVVASKHESLPMAIAESMAAGKTVIGSAVGGIPEMFEDGKSGFLVNIDSHEKTIGLLEKLHNNHDLIVETSINARALAKEKFHCNQIAKATVAFYSNILNAQ
jgi:glycosyltransferase involved in cell wall biosynthesis